MTQDLSVSPAAASAVSSVTASDLDRRSLTPPVEQTQPKANSGPGHPNPALRFEPSLGLVVLEFLDSSGDVAQSIPTQRQLDAYRARIDQPPNELPKPDTGIKIAPSNPREGGG